MDAEVAAAATHRGQAASASLSSASTAGEVDRAIGVGRRPALADRHDQRVGHVEVELEAGQLRRRKCVHLDRVVDERAQQLRQRSFVGTGAQVRDGLLALADETGADEVVVITWTWDPAAQRRSYELLAQAFGLQAAAG